ncbi:MAG TPA: M13 family metallopeptidase [Opitutaceae bacterium]|jgi:putative endopeptidase|nr:M13 family metallopeptidase [Opitutaceae bacterium]
MSRPIFLAVLAALSLVFVARAEIDPRNFDPAAKPQDDFYQFANGGWLKANPVPPEYSRWGMFEQLEEHNETALRSLLEHAAAQAATGSPIERMVGDFYASGMDEAAIKAAGIAPLKPELDRLAAIKTAADVQAALSHLHTLGIGAGFTFGSEPDPKDSTMVIASNGQGGLGLPDRDFYFRTDDRSTRLRVSYVAHMTRIFTLAGEQPETAQTDAQAVMQLETALAKGSKTRVQLRDPVANYHRMTVGELQKLTPHFDWKAYFAVLGLADPGSLDAGQPEFLQAFDAELAAEPVAAWQAYLRWHLLHAAVSYLGSDFVDANFAFYGKTLSGLQKLRERWKRVLATVDNGVGEALGQLYVSAYFPPEAKARALQLVQNLRTVLRARLQTLEWMDEPTRAEALKKIDALNVKIGYPDKWRDYSSLTIDRGSYVLNVFRAQAFEVRRDLAKIGRPVDRGEWQMTPSTINAYYDPQMNEIVFPAGILQPPFFDAHADDASNYGGIGCIIGHEMTHGYDDEGRQFDAHGNLRDWWTPESAARFQQRSAAIVKQFSGYVAVDSLHLNGELTQGENIADLGGVKLSYTALEKVLAGQSHAKVDGFTPEQRFFLSFASIWRNNIRPEAARLHVQTDPHSPGRFRVIGPLSNLPEFFSAFDVPEGAPMRRPENERVVIW